MEPEWKECCDEFYQVVLDLFQNYKENRGWELPKPGNELIIEYINVLMETMNELELKIVLNLFLMTKETTRWIRTKEGCEENQNSETKNSNQKISNSDSPGHKCTQENLEIELSGALEMLQSNIEQDIDTNCVTTEKEKQMKTSKDIKENKDLGQHENIDLALADWKSDCEDSNSESLDENDHSQSKSENRRDDTDLYVKEESTDNTDSDFSIIEISDGGKPSDKAEREDMEMDTFESHHPTMNFDDLIKILDTRLEDDRVKDLGREIVENGKRQQRSITNDDRTKFLNLYKTKLTNMTLSDKKQLHLLITCLKTSIKCFKKEKIDQKTAEDHVIVLLNWLNSSKDKLIHDWNIKMVKISSGLYLDSLISKKLSEEIQKKMKKMDDSVMYAFYLTHILLYAEKQYQLEKVRSGSNNSGKFSSTQRQVKQMEGASGLKELETSYVENVSAIKINLKQRLENIDIGLISSTSSASASSENDQDLERVGINAIPSTSSPVSFTQENEVSISDDGRKFTRKDSLFSFENEDPQCNFLVAINKLRENSEANEMMRLTEKATSDENKKLEVQKKLDKQEKEHHENLAKILHEIREHVAQTRRVHLENLSISRQYMAVFMACVQMKQIFEQKETDWADWLRILSEVIFRLKSQLKLLQKIIKSLNEEDRECQKILKSEISSLHESTLSAYNCVFEACVTVKSLSEKFPDHFFLLILYEKLVKVTNQLCTILENADLFMKEPTSIKIITQTFADLKPSGIPNTDQLREESKNGFDFSNIRNVEDPKIYRQESSVRIEEVGDLENSKKETCV